MEDQLQEKLKNFLLSKIENGDETGLTVDDLKHFGYMWADENKIAICPYITDRLSETTLKELFEFYRELS